MPAARIVGSGIAGAARTSGTIAASRSRETILPAQFKRASRVNATRVRGERGDVLLFAACQAGFATHVFRKARLSEPLNLFALASFLQAAVFIALAPVAVPARLGEANAHASVKAMKIRAVDFIKLPLLLNSASSMLRPARQCKGRAKSRSGRRD